ncbi:Oligogalacturonate-specific porin [[Enterobacter] lignolyticus]|uniref:Oligogalacturonate-specific porin n=1 Tax=Enterobacter lignolyticus (strain SCF1) TaxID=701347 RepID=E3GBY1_ENTLS|nr:Oligogalacturonate-specific porin [[Enterobacter] lignolyticus]ADO47775.1 Oligogalacturonate-specific porin [[Enterobacter] lignolyticus SCF1]
MTHLFKISTLSFCLFSFSVGAVSLDYRHEYKSDSKTNADRLKISHTSESGYFASVEGKLAEGTTTQSDGFKESNGHYSGSGSEWEFGRNYKITDDLTLAPAVNLDIGDTYVGYRAQIKAIYKISDTWMTTFRWRPGIEVSEQSGTDNKNYNQFNWEFGYTGEQISVIGDLEYRTTNYEDYNGHNYYWLYNIVASYKIDKNWTPYTEIGYVPRYNADHESDAMEMRYRLGVKYNF